MLEFIVPLVFNSLCSNVLDSTSNGHRCFDFFFQRNLLSIIPMRRWNRFDTVSLDTTEFKLISNYFGQTD